MVAPTETPVTEPVALTLAMAGLLLVHVITRPVRICPSTSSGCANSGADTPTCIDTVAGDTATDYDTTGHFLVLCEGDFDTEQVTEAQLNGAALVCAWAMQQFGIGLDTLASHQQVAPGETDCPGRSLQAHVTSGDLKKRITDTVTGGFELRPVCGSEADARVAGIVAGR